MLNSDEPVLVEQWANYQKQTLHNRCWIDSPNGKLSLTVPVDRSTFVQGKCLMKDVQVSYHQDWQKQHWYALESSYFNSPFFEYLQDDFRPIYNKRWKWLMDLNEELVAKCLEVINLDVKMERTKEFTPIVKTTSDFGSQQPTTSNPQSSILHPPSSTLNLQPSILNPQPSTLNPQSEYYQVFKAKNGFLPDLSIIDLIFNMGPESILYLKVLK